MRGASLLFLFLILPLAGFGQSSIMIDKLDRTSISQATKEVGFSSLLEGTVPDPNLEVYVLVKGPNDTGWRLFPATTDFRPEAPGRYRWRAICLFGKLHGEGIGQTHQIQVVAAEKNSSLKGVLAQAIAKAPQTGIISLKRTK